MEKELSIKIINEIFLAFDLNANKLSQALGMKRAQGIYDVLNPKKLNVGISKELAEKICTAFPTVNKAYLLTGIGSLFESEPKINNEKRGVPYYDVDFIGGYDLVINDKTTIPAYYIDFQQYNKADNWVNITGHSMEPLISHGDIIAIKRLEDWRTYLLPGEIYVIVTAEYRTVKKVRTSKKGDDYFRLVPLNNEFDEQDIPKSIIDKVYQVLGAAKKIF